MKRKLFLFSTAVLCLASCGANHRTNYIVPGKYTGVDLNNELFSYCLLIEPISQKEYLSSSGINVVEDLVKHGYYSLSLYTENDRNEQISFYNLEDGNNGIKAEPIFYVDSKNSVFCPRPTSLSSQKNKVYFKAIINDNGQPVTAEALLVEIDHYE